MKIAGVQKLTLLDYPGKLSATLFLSGCNLRCPYCHNSSLLTRNEKGIDQNQVLDFLQCRKHVLEGVCVTGGEPLLRNELPDFLRQIKELGYLIKLDTNGTRFPLLKEVCHNHLVDYVAMDIKNSREKYRATCGCTKEAMESVEKSVKFLMEEKIPYEFRTTLTKELHTQADIEEIGDWIKGAKAYYLQSYKESEDVLEKRFHPWENKELLDAKQVLLKNISQVEIRGVDV